MADKDGVIGLNRRRWGVAVLGAMLLLAFAGGRARAQGRSHDEEPSGAVGRLGQPTEFALENRPQSAFEAKLMRELRCMCGCSRQSIAACRCKFAATMRGEVHAMLKGKDLSTAAARRSAEKQVLHAFAAEYGDDVLHPPLDAGQAGMSWIPISIFGGALLLVIIVSRRAKRRPRGA